MFPSDLSISKALIGQLPHPGRRPTPSARVVRLPGRRPMARSANGR